MFDQVLNLNTIENLGMVKSATDAEDVADLKLMDVPETVVPMMAFDLLCSSDSDQGCSMNLNCAAFDDC